MLGVDKLIKQIKKHEGVDLHPYVDTVGKLTIGVGRNIQDNGISEAEAEFMLMNDLNAVMDEAKKFEWYSSLNEPRKAVVLNMLFNLGLPRFKGFQNTIAFLIDGMYNEAAEEMLQSRWANQVGNRALELSEQMRTGEWQ